MCLRIPLKYPYSFDQTTKRLRYFSKSSYLEKDGTFYRAMRLKTRTIVVGISYIPMYSALEIQVDQPLSSLEELELLEIVKRVWSTEIDLTPFYNHLEDKVLRPIVLARQGLHLILDPDIYECFIKTIIGQQLQTSFAAKLEQRLIELVGDQIDYHGDTFWVFPTAEQIAKLTYEDLQKLQYSRRKAEYIIDISRLIVNGRLDLNNLWDKSNEEVMELLLPLRGVGRWTIECILLFGLGRSDLLPAADIGLRNAVKMAYGLEKQPTENDIRKLGAAWAPYESYVTFYLWDYITQNKK
ncbi:DNA-3-methyladenine glycosylase family protein [Thermoflavimicrobium daqui]|uniref:DNA-3-methyladenine glycosylase family protein n=1 Tax=Thermoflavimicrobium daqui TaxID=2137476 RepID=UPI00143D4071|nr:DNA-3-methyladenine glycosylase [Thermoflavimicrobium daqui]